MLSLDWPWSARACASILATSKGWFQHDNVPPLNSPVAKKKEVKKVKEVELEQEEKPEEEVESPPPEEHHQKERKVRFKKKYWNTGE